MSMYFWEPSDQKPEPAKEMLKKEIKPELTQKGKMIMNEKEQIIKRLEYLKNHSFDASRKTDCAGSCRSTYIECCMWLSFLCLLDEAIKYIKEH